MAASSMAIDTSIIEELLSTDIPDVDVMNAMIDEIVTKYNAMLDTATGHDHDGTNSRYLSSGHYTMAEIEAMIIMGVYT